MNKKRGPQHLNRQKMLKKMLLSIGLPNPYRVSRNLLEGLCPLKFSESTYILVVVAL